MSNKLVSCRNWILSKNPSIESIASVIPKLEKQLKELTCETEQEDYLETVDFLTNISELMIKNNTSSFKVLETLMKEATLPSLEPIPRKECEKILGGEHSLHAEIDSNVVALCGNEKLAEFSRLKNTLGINLSRN